MRALEWKFRDKSEWGDGPWQDEPDKMQWQDEATGLPCLIVRGPMGALCGYVGVGPDHPLYRVDYGKVDGQIEVHGGLTFSDSCDETNPEHGICHRAEACDFEPAWWFGFDCAHAWDVAPKSAAYSRARGWPEDRDATYRSAAYVRAQVTQLAEQIARHPGVPSNSSS